ncbi:hypothetical protein AKJ44_03045 [candidate division MSBL1 archaeon SCGC-AAA261F17]|uniref:Transposase IS66 central domain-containing protein n=1 Tax=candidate division MSBL1 archaeon SCGC-AAA261F17 TaxID=1698274 RepID=A0A133V3J4_9EURY|nr:hypothetical protein AKJ44_03045 [candidate division MSBL1 archaeon SCGC-AAA261F17]
MTSEAKNFPVCSATCPAVTALQRKVEELEEELARKDEKVEKLKGRLRMYENAHTPSSKKRKGKTERNRRKEEETDERPESERENDKKRFPGKPEGSNGGGISVPNPDRVKHHMLEEEGFEEIDTRERTLIELHEKPFEVVRHVIHVYEDLEGQRVEPEVNLPEGIYGKRLQAFITLLRGTCGASHEKIAELVQLVRPDLSFSPTTSLNLTDKIARQMRGKREGILEEIKQNPYVHMDETGLREDGVNGWVWEVADQRRVVYEVDRSRSKEVPEKTMGNYDGVVVDGYSAYNSFTKQRDWDHLKREVKETEIEGAVSKFRELHGRAKRAKEKPPTERERFIQEARDSEFPSLIETLREKGEEEKATGIENALPDMFRGVKDPTIPLSNNHAERLLRKVVVHRKLWGCIRNEKGARFIENVLSCMETWKLQDKNVFQELLKFTS